LERGTRCHAIPLPAPTERQIYRELLDALTNHRDGDELQIYKVEGATWAESQVVRFTSDYISASNGADGRAD